ncbi:hypothetical protein RP20_CCG003004 [Aedes albopictus]|nr:hypothetical protein RP20_CCG003004 [Aedes albopictus]
MSEANESSSSSSVTNNLLDDNRKNGAVRVQIVPSQPKTLSHLPPRPAVDLAFHKLSYRVKEGRKNNVKTILKEVSGKLRSGELTAIMGPSGAGKSTLLNILTGYKYESFARKERTKQKKKCPPRIAFINRLTFFFLTATGRTTNIEGSITMNGKERNLSQFRKLSAYIMQDNQLHANLTVQEAMHVAASLKLSQKVEKSEKLHVIKEILDTLGLDEHRATLTRNLSGGQQKRLSIALELVNNPPIMFFDEPTSGLDSSTCFQCVSLLKFLARGGRTIICTIHQPSARLFEMFDQLYTLADGQCVYQGNTKQLVPFLGTLDLECPSYHNPASYIIEVACGEHGDHTRKLVNAIDNGKRDIRGDLDFPAMKNKKNENGNANANLKSNYDKLNGNSNKYADNLNIGGNGLLPSSMVNDIAKETTTETIKINVEPEKEPEVNTALLPIDGQLDVGLSPERYPTSEFHQFWVVLKRTLLFSRRDWTLMYLRLFAHILVGFLIGALYYDIGNDGAKVLSNLGFLFFNMLFLMYTSMTITILSC